MALRYGWIDGHTKRVDDDYYVQRFTPRRARSKWSKINCAKAEALIASGAMQPAGLAEVERAKADGRWDAAYDAPSTATVPDDLRAALDADPRGERVLRDARRQQPLRDPAPAPGRQEARDAGAPDREVRGDAQPRRDDSPAPRGAVAAHLRVDAALVHRAPAPGAVAAAVEEQPAAVAAHLQPRRAGPSGGGRPRRPRSATAGGPDDARSTPSPLPRSSPRGPRRRARRVGTEGAARRPVAARYRGEHVVDRARAARGRGRGPRDADAPGRAARRRGAPR